jgi:hypothetical protein
MFHPDPSLHPRHVYPKVTLFSDKSFFPSVYKDPHCGSYPRIDVNDKGRPLVDRFPIQVLNTVDIPYCLNRGNLLGYIIDEPENANSCHIPMSQDWIDDYDSVLLTQIMVAANPSITNLESLKSYLDVYISSGEVTAVPDPDIVPQSDSDFTDSSPQVASFGVSSLPNCYTNTSISVDRSPISQSIQTPREWFQHQLETKCVDKNDPVAISKLLSTDIREKVRSYTDSSEIKLSFNDILQPCHDLPESDILINNTRIKSLIDSGSNFSIMNYDLAHKMSIKAVGRVLIAADSLTFFFFFEI